MNLSSKYFLLLCWLMSIQAAAEVSPEIYQSYARLQQLAQKAPAQASPEIDKFYRFAQHKSAEVRLLAGQIYLQNSLVLKKFPQALTHIEVITQLPLSDEQALTYNLLGAQLSYQLAHYSETVGYLQHWLNIAANQAVPTLTSTKKIADTHVFLANAYYQLAKYTPAINQMITAMNISQRQERDYRFLFMLYEHEKRKAEARALLIKMTQYYPANGEYWERLGYSYLETDQTEQAIAVFDMAQQAGYLPTRSWLTLAQLFISQNMSQKAITLLAQAKREQKIALDEVYFQLLANAHIVAREHIGALTSFEELAKTHALSTAQQQQQAQIAYQLGKWAQAKPILHELAQKQSDNPQWRFMLAISCYELRQYSEAVVQFKQLTEPQYQEIARQWIEQVTFLTTG